MTPLPAPDLRGVAIGALAVHLGFGTASIVLFLAAYGFDPQRYAEPAAVLTAGRGSAELLRWAAAADLLGYYLAAAAVAYVLWRLLRPRGPALADLSLIGALGYALAGGGAAAALAVAGPMLMHAHGEGTADQATIAALFAVLSEVVFRGIWQFLDMLLLAGWWAGLGMLLRDTQPRLSLLSLALAVAAIVVAVLTLAGFGAARDLVLGLFFVGWFAWSSWLLVLFWRRSLSPP